MVGIVCKNICFALVYVGRMSLVGTQKCSLIIYFLNIAL